MVWNAESWVILGRLPEEDDWEKEVEKIREAKTA